MNFCNKSINFSNTHSVKIKYLIGTGGFSNIYSTNDPSLVVKVINISDKKAFDSYSNEKYAYSQLSKPHKNILKCLGKKEEKIKNNSTFSFLLLENCPYGDLSDILAKSFPLSETIILSIIKEIAEGINIIHSKKLIHRDIKLENILIGQDYKLKICDFGSISKKIYQEIKEQLIEEIEEDIAKNTTPNYRAPEQCELFNFKPLSEKVDSWALGCILFLLCYQYFPFESKLATINKHYFLPEFPKYSEKIDNLMNLLFENDPFNRISPLEVISYINNVISDKFVDLDDFFKNKVRDNNIKIKEIKPKFFQSVFLYYKKLTNKSEGWFLSAIEENENAPGQTFVRLLVIKAWNNKNKIQKFYKLFDKYIIQKHNENSIILLKSLILFHNYLKKGPNDVLLLNGSSNFFLI